MDEPDQPDPIPSPPSALCAELLDPDCHLTPAQTLWLEDAATRVLTLAAARFAVHGQLRARILDDTAMAAAHLKYSNIPGTTDVLTFDLSETESEIDTDLYLCINEATRQSAELHHPVEQELLLYLVHGLLHCLGHDDHDPEAYAVMHALEDELLTAAGIAPTFHAQSQPSSQAQGGAPS